VNAVLGYVNYNSDDLLQRLRTKTEDAALDEGQRRLCIAALEDGLNGYTYLED
jgi:arginine decarboxylase